jgi:hypothetical protein
MSNQRDMQCANQSLLGEDVDQTSSLSKKLSMIAGARRHLEAGHEKYILDIIQSHPALAALGGSTGNLQRIRAFLRVSYILLPLSKTFITQVFCLLLLHSEQHSLCQ